MSDSTAHVFNHYTILWNRFLYYKTSWPFNRIHVDCEISACHIQYFPNVSVQKTFSFSPSWSILALACHGTLFGRWCFDTSCLLCFSGKTDLLNSLGQKCSGKWQRKLLTFVPYWVIITCFYGIVSRKAAQFFWVTLSNSQRTVKIQLTTASTVQTNRR